MVQGVNGRSSPRFGPYTEPAVVLTYGDSGIGKSMDKLRAMPRAIWLTPPGGLKCAIGELGYTPEQIPVRNIWECFAVLDQLAKLDAAQLAERYDGIGIDDWSVIIEDSFHAMKGQYGRSGDSVFRLWEDLLGLTIDFRSWTRALGLHVLMNAHEMPPSADSKTGVYYKGGPELPSKKHVRKLPHVADAVLRAMIEPGRKPWPGIHVCDASNANYHMKDRHGIAPARGPLNTGELLRLAGYPIRRLPGLEWQDSCAEQIAGEIQVEGADRLVIASRWLLHLTEQDQIPMHHAAWAVQDGMDRAEMRMTRQRERLAAFGAGSASPEPPGPGGASKLGPIQG